jgi:hypothetical protein
VPFVRYARDKRGYESTYVMHAYRPGQGPQRARVLYLFRTPAHVKIGRRALEPEVMEALEHTHPDLSFDWTNLPTERPAEAAEPRERDHRREWAAHNRQSGRHGRPAPAAARTPSGPPSPPPVIEDESLLGRVIGAQRAAQLRGRYAELTLRIGRRARTPEDRDRLLERMQRLNPDEWMDEAAVRTAALTVEAEWDAVTAELPGRRRGRRGGRNRRDSVDGEPLAGSSGIIEESGPLANQQDGGYEDADLAVDPDGPVARGERDGDFGPDLTATPAPAGPGDVDPGADE